MELKFRDWIELTVEDKYWFILIMLIAGALAGYKMKCDHEENIALIDLKNNLVEAEKEESI